MGSHNRRLDLLRVLLDHLRALVAFAVLVPFFASANFRVNVSAPGLTIPNTGGLAVRSGTASEMCEAFRAAAVASGRSWIQNPHGFGPNLTLSSSSGGSVCSLDDTRASPPYPQVVVSYDTAGYRCGPEASYVTLPRGACTTCSSGYVLSGGTCRLPTACDDTTSVAVTGQLHNLGTGFSNCFNGCAVAASVAPLETCISFGSSGANPVCAAGSSATQWRRTGAACSSSPASTSAPTLSNSPNSATLGGGSAGCGTFNGEYRCLPEIPSGACVTTAGGQAFCSASAGTPPKPNNGVPGVPASPSLNAATAQGGVTNNYQVFNTTTVNNSVPGTGSGSSGGTGGGSGSTGGGGTGGTSGGISGGVGCDAAPSCDSDPVQCYIANQSWQTTCALARPSPEAADASISEGFGGDGSGLFQQIASFDVSEYFNPSPSSASCPSDITIQLVGVFASAIVVPLSKWCTFLRLIGLLVLAAASLVSLRIFGEAF